MIFDLDMLILGPGALEKVSNAFRRDMRFCFVTDPVIRVSSMKRWDIGRLSFVKLNGWTNLELER